MPTRTPRLRLRSHLLAGNPAATHEAVVAHFGAMQAQDYRGALWAIGVRTQGLTERAVEGAIDARRIVRCWPMRGTLHLVAAPDVRWMLALLAPRVLERNRPRLEREFELDRATLRRARRIVEGTLRRESAATRPELYAALAAGGVPAGRGRGLHVLFALAHERVICFGARRGKQPTFALLDAWVPPSPPKAKDEALAELAARYRAGHAPAGVADFAWWSGLTMREAKEAFALAGPEDDAPPPRRAQTVHLLPPFDEYTVAYRDRSAVVDPAFAKRVNAGGGMLNAIVVVDGIVEGTWTRRLSGRGVRISVSSFRRLTPQQGRRLEREARRYADFIGADAVVLD